VAKDEVTPVTNILLEFKISEVPPSLSGASLKYSQITTPRLEYLMTTKSS